MNNKPQDPLIESLMQLAVSAAPLIKRARDSGIFKTGTPEAKASETVVEATVVTPEPVKPAEPAPDFTAEKAALQQIIVDQAMKIAALEAELAKLRSVKPKRAKA